MQPKKEVQHVYLVGAKSLGAYGGYETFVYKLTEHHRDNQNIISDFRGVSQETLSRGEPV